MNRDTILKLDERVWKTLEPSDLKVCLVPSGLPDLSSQMFGMDPETLTERICTRAFVDFKNYMNGDGKPIENSVDARRELYRVPFVRAQVNRLLQQLNQEIVLGESVAALD